jgi:predicted RNase H-like HicB family nuclease
MTAIAYRASVKSESGGFAVAFPNIPEAIAEGKTRAEALAAMGKRLVVAVEDA